MVRKLVVYFRKPLKHHQHTRRKLLRIHQVRGGLSSMSEHTWDKEYKPQDLDNLALFQLLMLQPNLFQTS